jgi:hypothetical protein
MTDTGSTAGIAVGDAVVSFIADMTQLDQGVDQLNTRIEAGMTRASQNVSQLDNALTVAGDSATEAGGEIDSAMGKSTGSIREARGEAMLLGEAFGVHLPRHVNAFIAELPGVGEALQSAFAATAVLFIIEAIVKLTEKTSDFVSEVFIFTSAMKDAEAALGGMNTEQAKLVKELNDSKTALDRVGESTRQLAIDRVNDKYAETIGEINSNLAKQNASLEKQDSWLVRIGMSFRLNAAYAAHDAAQAAKLEEQRANEAQAEQQRTIAAKTQANELAAIQKQGVLDRITAEHKYAEEVTKIISQMNEEEYEKTEKTAAAMQKALLNMLPKAPELSMSVSLDKVSAALARATEAAHYFGQETKAELTVAVKEAVDNFMALQKEAGVTEVQLKNAGDQVVALQAKLNNFDKAPVNAAKGLSDMLEVTKQLSQAEEGFGEAYGQAVAKIVTGEESIGAAMRKATGEVIEQMGERALVQGMYDLGMGFASLAAMDPDTAALYFQASAIELSIGAAATAGGAAIAGGGSSSRGASGGSYSGTGTTGVTTSGSGSAPGPTQTTTKFAEGGLISAPTLAMIGDAPGGGAANEAVLPLDSPEAMAKIANAISSRMSGGALGGSHTFNATFFGKLKHADLASLTKQISQAVNKGTISLRSTQTGRVIKRSQ